MRIREEHRFRDVPFAPALSESRSVAIPQDAIERETSQKQRPCRHTDWYHSTSIRTIEPSYIGQNGSIRVEISGAESMSAKRCERPVTNTTIKPIAVARFSASRESHVVPPSSLLTASPQSGPMIAAKTATASTV